MYATATPPVRATTSLTISVQMLNIPVSLYTGSEETRVARKEFLATDTTIPVGRSPIRKDTGDVIDVGDVVRMAQASNGDWVTLTDDEIAACTAPKGVAEVVTFVPVKDFAQYLPEKLYQVRPKREKGKPNVAAERAFGLLLAGMKARKVGALLKLAMRGPARYAILTTDGDLIMVLTADAVRRPCPLDAWVPTKQEVAMVTSFIDAVGVDAPVITDDTAPVVQAYVDSKASGAPIKSQAAAPAVTDNLMAALQASIDAAKKGKVA
jgi:non-homologous end joining protein Ku